MSLEHPNYTHRLRLKKRGDHATFRYGINSHEGMIERTLQTTIIDRPLPNEYPVLRKFILRNLVQGSGVYYPIGTLTELGNATLIAESIEDIRIKGDTDPTQWRQSETFLGYAGVTLGLKIEENFLQYHEQQYVVPELYGDGDILFLPDSLTKDRRPLLIGPLKEIY